MLPSAAVHCQESWGAFVPCPASLAAVIVVQTVSQETGSDLTERMMRRYAAVTDATLRRAAEAVSGNGAWQSSATAPLK